MAAPPPLHDSNLEDADAVVDASATRKKNHSDMIVIILKSRREAEAAMAMWLIVDGLGLQMVCAHACGADFILQKNSCELSSIWFAFFLLIKKGFGTP